MLLYAAGEEQKFMNLHFLGGAMEIGGSCIYIRIAGKGILLDSGIRQSAAKDPIPDFRTVQEQGGVDAVIISHAHMDHIGTLPMISRAYPLAPIYMTAMTQDLTRVLLYDSLKIMNHREDEIPHYSEQDVLAMLGRIRPVGYETPFQLFEGFTMTLYPAGHIAGAACVYLVTEEGSLFYSGDFSSFSQRTIEGIRIPKLRPDVALVETTYGNRLHANRMAEEKRLVALVRECIAEKKKILIPTFALGRAQEVLLILRSAIQNQEIPPVPVFVDGMVRDINQMYTRNPTYLKNALGKRILKGNEPFYTREIQPVSPVQKRDELLSAEGPFLLISSSGMLTGGPSAQYAKALAPLENACIIITGYQDEESPGRQLLSLLENPEEKSLTVNGTTVPVGCRVEQVGLSAHGDKSEIAALLSRLSARRIFLVHGNRDAMEELGSELAAEDYRRQVFLPECGQEYEVLLRSRRKQLSFSPAESMQMPRAFEREDGKLLWDFWRQHYPGKAFSLYQIAGIWYGRESGYEEGISDEEVLGSLREKLLGGAYFSPNERRLFLFEANEWEAVEKAKRPKEFTMQELEAKIQVLFPGFSYRKISYHYEKREILLQFDYPDVQDREVFRRAAEAFSLETGWSAKIHPSVNHNAASLFLSALFGERISKTSYYPERRCYQVTLSGTPDSAGEREAAEQFLRTTGWRLLLGGTAASSDDSGSSFPGGAGAAPGAGEEDFFFPADSSADVLEQNMAFSCIEQSFLECPHRPEKKSLKQDGRGKYLELSFVSPEIGRQYQDTLQALADWTGWRIHISDKVNQNALFHTAQLICRREGLTLLKNPSYLPGQRRLQIKAGGEESPEKLNRIKEAFFKQTGLACIFV